MLLNDNSKLFKIVSHKYSPDGALTSEKVVQYAATPQDAQEIYEENSNAKQENGMKAYRPKLYTLGYKEVADPAALFGMF